MSSLAGPDSELQKTFSHMSVIGSIEPTRETDGHATLVA
jgi:hypothetical protein